MLLADTSFGEGLLYILEFFMLFAWIWILISVIADLFRDHELSGVAKAVWVFFLVFLPFFGVLLYLIVRGGGMRDRTIKHQADTKKEMDSYVREQAQAGSPAEELHKLNDLKEKGALSSEEFEQGEGQAAGLAGRCSGERAREGHLCRARDRRHRPRRHPAAHRPRPADPARAASSAWLAGRKRRTCENVDAVLISHLHRDHADLPSLRRLGDVPLLVPAGGARFFERRGFGSVSELAVGQSAEVGALTVSAVEAVHDGAGKGSRDAEAIGFLDLRKPADLLRRRHRPLRRR